MAKENSIMNKKSVRFQRYLGHEDLALDVIGKTNKESKFYDSYIFNKLEKSMNMMSEQDHFNSSIKLQFSVEKHTRSTLRLDFSDHKSFINDSHKKGNISNFNYCLDIDRDFQNIIRPRINTENLGRLKLHEIK